jgi:hypothetical protein
VHSSWKKLDAGLLLMLLTPWPATKPTAAVAGGTLLATPCSFGWHKIAGV